MLHGTEMSGGSEECRCALVTPRCPLCCGDSVTADGYNVGGVAQGEGLQEVNVAK